MKPPRGKDVKPPRLQERQEHREKDLQIVFNFNGHYPPTIV
jgi:hypothetical protein